jgi:hypothetical protein
MPVPYLHIYHPAPSRAPHIIGWIAEVEDALRADANWTGCQFSRRQYTEQAGFNVGTEVEYIRKRPGPVIFLQKVQRPPHSKFRAVMEREILIHPLFAPTCPEDILEACEHVRLGHEHGEPHIPLRELIAYLILAKLERLGKWGGTALNKSFLWSGNLAKGGFPKDIVAVGDVNEVADFLCAKSVLSQKLSDGQRKFALGSKDVVQPVLDTKNFDTLPHLKPFFEKSRTTVSARYLSYCD